MNIPNINEQDIIETTPEKEVKTSRKKMKKSTSTNQHPLEDYVITPSTGNVCYQIHHTKIFSMDYNKPYIYYSIQEILQLSKNYVPKYNNILLVGKLIFHNSKGHYLMNNKEMRNSYKIKLNFKLLINIPDPDTVLSLYGSLEHEELVHSTVPVFMVRFYRYEPEGLFNKYTESLKFARNFVPSCYLELISVS